MLPNKYAYLTGTLMFMIPWVLFYLLRKDLRKEMLFMSVAVAIGSIVTSYFWWTKDWWRPMTITSTVVGIEDLILGFSNGGIAAVAYEEIYKKRCYRREKGSAQYEALSVILTLAFSTSFIFWGLKLTSFTASSIAMILSGVFLIYIRKDLLIDALVSGFIMVLISTPVYLILIFISPNLIENTYLFKYLSGLRILGIPIEELIFYFLFGFIIGPLYEVWQGYRLRRVNSNK
jgi:hypothetical protein